MNGVKVLINGVAYDAQDYVQRYDSGFSHLLDAEKRELYNGPDSYWQKGIEDAKAMVALACGLCFECGEPATWHFRKRIALHDGKSEFGLCCLRCDKHANPSAEPEEGLFMERIAQ